MNLQELNPDFAKVNGTYSKEVLVGWLSSAVEAYNMAIYSFLAPLLAPLMFKNLNDFNALLFSYLLVFLGHSFLYPLGALYYGRVGDLDGRRKICIYSTLGLAVATGLMGLLPDDMFIGGWLYFLILIGAQYFFSGGEYHGSIIFSLEHSHQQEKSHSGLMSSLSCLFAVFGLIIASGLASLTFQAENVFWIRCCFILGFFGGILSYVLKNSCRETLAYSLLNKKAKKLEKMHVFIRKHFLKILSSVFVFGFFMVSYSFIFIFLPLIDIEANIQEFSTFKTLICYGFFLILAGILADKIGLKKTIVSGLLLFSLFILPLSFFYKDLMLLQMALTPLACLVIGPVHSFMLQQFEVQERCRGIFTSSAISMLIFGGSTPPLCLMIFENTGSLVLCSLYPFSIAVVALFFLCFLTKNESTGINESGYYTCSDGHI